MYGGRDVSINLATIAMLIFFTGEQTPESAKAPAGAIMLFDGHDLSHWVMKKDGAPPAWKLENGYVEVVPGTGFLVTREKFGDFKLHVEFWIPRMPLSLGQARGNSGVYLQGRHEIQILDSYHNWSAPTGACGALYDTIAPFRNPAKPPEEWQTFDITYQAPRLDTTGQLTEPGDVSVVFNGVTVIDHGKFSQVTDRFGGAFDERVGTPGPIMLQDHGARIRFRSIWIVPSDK
jgi:3-keto-disaccharide hydrolase